MTFDHSRKILAPLVASAIAIIVVTNYCIVSPATTEQAISSRWPMALSATITVILVMSALYHALEEVLEELEERRNELVDKFEHDSLTGAASRELFVDRLGQALARFERNREKFAVIMLDLDHFKRVNDLHGHHSGDELLKQVAARLKSHLRATDTVARFGGDEFLILQTGFSKSAEVRRLCKRICDGLELPYDIGSLQLRIGTSAGAIVASREIRSPADYVRAADMALYEAKRAGRGSFRFFSDELDRQLRRRDVLERDLRHALTTSTGVEVHFQPQISADNQVTGAEALFRWTHPDLGEIAASEVIEIAEESNLIEQLGELVLRQSAAMARRYPELSFAVNLSPAQFLRCDNVAAKVLGIVRKEGVKPSQIEFEITEKLFTQSAGGSDSQVQSLRELGFRVALDDFGTGYSSLSYLRRFKVDRLKLDKSFIANADVKENIAVIRAAVSLAHMLGLEVVAEGIESELQEAVARQSGCDVFQGHRFGMPMGAAKFENFMKSNVRRAA